MAKIAFLSLIILILVFGFVAAVPNLARDETPRPELSSQAVEADVLEQFRIRRNESRQAQFEQLEDIMSNEGVQDEIRLDAGKMRLKLIDNMEKETTVEGVLMSRGFNDAVCTVHDESVNVLVRAKTISKSQSAVIMELTARETGISARNIKIIPVS